MPSNDTDKPLAQVGDVTASVGLLSRLPVSIDMVAAQDRGAAAAWAFPVAGLIVAVLAAWVASMSMGLGVSAAIAAGIALAVQIIITGAMHEDGLADSADGLWGGWDTERRLEIMKDSRIGTYGVLALGLSLLLRWAALTAIYQTGSIYGPMLAAAAVSRLPMLVLLALLPNARGEGLSASVGTPSKDTLALGSVVTLLAAVLLAGWGFVPLFIFGSLATLVCAQVARKKIGGQTGDILGATQQVVEITALITLASWLS